MKVLLLLLLLTLVISLTSVSSAPLDSPTFPPFGCENHAACYEGNLTVVKGSWNCTKCYCINGTTGPTCGKVSNFCKSNPCSVNTASCQNCVESFDCICNVGWAGATCAKNNSLCELNPCPAAKNKCEVVKGERNCSCPQFFKLVDNKCVATPCASSPCINGGTCKNDGISYICKCHTPWLNKNDCSVFNACLNVQCLNAGTCQLIEIGPGFNTTHKCACANGFEGVACEIDYCAPNPCKNKGICIRKPNNYSCNCQRGAYGRHCENNPNDCKGIYEYPNKKEYFYLGVREPPCNKKDEDAKCLDRLGRFICSCSPEFTGPFCDITKIRFCGRMQFWGIVSLSTIGTSHSNINRGLQVMQKLEELSNSRDPGSLDSKVLVNKKEYLPWVDTASILVFVHNMYDFIFSESVRYTCEPGGETILDVSKTADNVARYMLLDLLEACFRSCYQKIIYRECECMDPRYSMSSNATACTLAQRECLNEANEEAGDPYSWSWCDCPPACEVHNFFVSVNRAEYRAFEAVCANKTNPTSCINNNQDNVRVLVRMTELETKTYAEVATMSFSKFMATLGGLFGVLMGLSVTSFIEFVFLFFKILGILIFNRGAK